MSHTLNLKKLKFLVYGLGSTGISVIKYFKRKKISDFSVWDDNLKLRKKIQIKKYFKFKKYFGKCRFYCFKSWYKFKKHKI